MEPFDRRSGGERPVIRMGEASNIVGAQRESPPRASRVRTPRAYRVCDGFTGGLLCFMIVFTPWAFGTTQDWSIWTMNVTAYILGGLLVAKRVIRAKTGFAPARSGIHGLDLGSEIFPERRRHDRLTLALAVLTMLVLGYTLISAINARATYIEGERRFEYYRQFISWLPHSYDSRATWNSFWMYLGLAFFFWAARDWLLTRDVKHRSRSRDIAVETVSPAPDRLAFTGREALPSVSTAGVDELRAGSTVSASSRHELPLRLRLLLWVLCINGALLALEAILQRLSGTNELLWMVLPYFNRNPLEQFGPYAYRANAASYFNLIWPVCLGYWLVLRQSAKPSLRTGRRLGSGNHIVLLPGAVLMAACPIISTSRGGALIAVGTILISMALLLWIARKESVWFRVGTCSLFVVILAFSAVLGLKQLVPRFQTIFTDQMSQRTEIYANAVPIARDFPVLGTGPGTFGSLYQLYRKDVNQHWAAYVHDDWLETRITFGGVGFTLILLMLGIVAAHWFFGIGISSPWEFPAMMAVAMGGLLLHAKFDFPFQIYSIVLAFLLLCAILFSMARFPHRA